MRSAHRLDPRTAHKWLHTVVKHECFTVREQRARYVGVDDPALEALDDGRCEVSVQERAERFEELARAAEALRRLKPQEVTALVLKAQRPLSVRIEPVFIGSPTGGLSSLPYEDSSGIRAN